MTQEQKTCPECLAYLLEHPENRCFLKCPSCGYSVLKIKAGRLCANCVCAKALDEILGSSGDGNDSGGIPTS